MDYSKQRFERLFKNNYPHMYRMAFSIVENADDAKDAVHQVFTQVWSSKPKVADDCIRGYLLAATRNQCLHMLRSRHLQQQNAISPIDVTFSGIVKLVKFLHVAKAA